MRYLLLSILLMVFTAPCPAEWSADQRLTDDPGASLTEEDGGFNVKMTEDELFFVWSDNRDGNPEIYFKEFDGTQWHQERLTNDPGASRYPSLSRRYGGQLGVVFEDDRTGHPEIYWQARTYFGDWLQEICLTCDEYASSWPATSTNGEYLVWEDTRDGNSEIYFSHWRQDWAWWDDGTRISYDDATSIRPAVAGTSNWHEFAMVAWQDDRNGSWQIYSRQYEEWDGGWQPETLTSESTSEARNPTVCYDYSGSDVIEPFGVVAWEDTRHGPAQIYYRTVYPWALGYEQRPVSTMTGQSNPSMVFSKVIGPGIFGPQPWPRPRLVWQAYDPDSECWQIQYHDIDTMADGEYTTLSTTTVGASHPSIATWSAFLGIRVHNAVVWTDMRDGNPELYFAFNEEDYTAVDPDLPDRLVLGPGSPNPFNPHTQFTVDVATGQELALTVHDLQGGLVRTIFVGEAGIGPRTFSWDGANDRGEAMPSGVYILRARSGELTGRQKLTLIR